MEAMIHLLLGRLLLEFYPRSDPYPLYLWAFFNMFGRFLLGKRRDARVPRRMQVSMTIGSTNSILLEFTFPLNM